MAASRLHVGDVWPTYDEIASISDSLNQNITSAASKNHRLLTIHWMLNKRSLIYYWISENIAAFKDFGA